MCSFTFFHRPSLRRRISNREYLTYQGLLASVMVICALASARVRDGAASPSAGMPDTQNWSPEAFTRPRKVLRPRNRLHAHIALLALLSIQSGQINACS